jgi:hypothetical protein
MLEGTTTSSREWREQVDMWWSERLDIPHLTPRWVLQYWGTEVCRSGFHDDIWIASLENKLRNTKDHVVISDCRFANEVKAIKNAGGITIRVSRGENPIWYDAAIEYNKGPNGNTLWALSKAKLEKNKVHASEYSSIGLNYDYHLENNGSIDDLYQQVQSIINI